MVEFLRVYIFFFVILASGLAFGGFTKEGGKFSILWISVVFFLSVVVLISRNPIAPSDSNNYLMMYAEQVDFESIFTAYHGNLFFSFTQYIGNVFGFSGEEFLIIQTLFIYTISFLGFRFIFLSNKMLLMAFSFFVLTSTFVLLFTNVIRQGLALSLFLLAIGLLFRKNVFLSYFTLLLAVFSHFSAIILLFIFFAVRSFHLKSKHLHLVILITPFLPVFSDLFLSRLASIGGLFNKIESFSSKEYNNSLVYVKVLILYLSLIGFYYFGVFKKAFNNERYFFIFKIYLCLVVFVFFTLPVLLLSSRYLYYSSAMLPILYTYALYHQPNIVGKKVRFYFGLVFSILYGVFVYSFKSTRMQLGI